VIEPGYGHEPAGSSLIIVDANPLLERVGRVRFESSVTTARAVARTSARRTGPTDRLSHPSGLPVL